MIANAQRVLWMTIVVVLAAASAAGADSGKKPVPGNLDLMTTLASDAVGELVTRIDTERAGRGLRLKPYANTEDYKFIGNVITTVLTQRGIPVYQPPTPGMPATNDDALDLQFQALEFSIVYPRVFRSHLFGGKHVRRMATISLVTTLVDPAEGSVVRVDQASRDAEDEFAHRDLARVEQGTLDFVHPEMPGSGWGRAVEPVFVSGIIVGLIYLFFSNQSAN